MRMLVALILVAGACDQGIKPKPPATNVAAATAAPAPVHLPDSPFTAGAWDAIAPVLTFQRAH